MRARPPRHCPMDGLQALVRILKIWNTQNPEPAAQAAHTWTTPTPTPHRATCRYDHTSRTSRCALSTSRSAPTIYSPSHSTLSALRNCPSGPAVALFLARRPRRGVSCAWEARSSFWPVGCAEEAQSHRRHGHRHPPWPCWLYAAHRKAVPVPWLREVQCGHGHRGIAPWMACKLWSGS